MRSEALWFLDDAYGVMLSQYGYQESYDSASQQLAGIDDVTADPREVQGWNGFGIVRTTSELLDLDHEVKSLQFEADLITDQLDILDQPNQDTWPGVWVENSFRHFVTDDEYDAMKVTMDRYLPKWKWDRFENY